MKNKKMNLAQQNNDDESILLLKDKLGYAICPYCGKHLTMAEIVEEIKRTQETELDWLLYEGSILVNDIECSNCKRKFNLSMTIACHVEK